MNKRAVVIHYHIFKNAGSTIDYILSRNFGPSHGSIESDNPWDTLEPQRLLEYIRDNPGLRAVSSHHARLPAPVDDAIAFYPIVFLRHPIDRAGSVYAFESRQPEGSPSLGARIARQQDIAGYIRWRLSAGNGAVIRNFQVVHLAGRQKDMRTAVATAADLNTAKECLARLAFFGIVEFFGNSILGLGQYLSGAFNAMDVSFEVQNKSQERRGDLDERLEELRSLLGYELYGELVSENALDLELYEYAQNLFRMRSNTGCRSREAELKIGQEHI